MIFLAGREFQTSVGLFETAVAQMHTTAFDIGFVDESPVINHELLAAGKTCVISWLGDAEFKSGLEKNPTSYYFGIATNLVVCGMYYAQKWAEDEPLADIGYADIYNGGLWTTVYELLEDKTDKSKEQFTILAGDLYDIWTSLIRPYMKLSNAGQYLIDTLVAFFQTGVDIKLSIIDKG